LKTGQCSRAERPLTEHSADDIGAFYAIAAEERSQRRFAPDDRLESSVSRKVGFDPHGVEGARRRRLVHGVDEKHVRAAQIHLVPVNLCMRAPTIFGDGEDVRTDEDLLRGFEVASG
jgi:hypothetical protein